MHISDGILPGWEWGAGLVITGAATGLVLRRFDERRIPQVAVLSSLFFVASSIRVPVGPGSMHLVLNGLLGVVLGWDAILAVLLSLFLQAILLAHGGLTAIGVNTVTMAGGAVAAHYAFRLRRVLGPGERLAWAFGLLAGAVGLLVSTGLFYLALAPADPAYRPFAGLTALL